MRIESLKAHYFEGIQHLSVSFETPVVLVCGDNNSGKSSLRDAIHFVVAGESGRVDLKKDYGDLVYEGADPKDASITISIDGAEYSRKVKNGAATVEMPDWPILFPYMTGFTSISELPKPEFQRLLAKISKVKPSKLKVSQMMQQAGISDECIAAALPMLSAGFPSAHKAAKSRVSECRGAWEQLTGERYGTSKGQTWKHEPKNAAEGDSPEEIKASLKQAEAIRDKLADKFKTMRKEHGVFGKCPECDVKLVHTGQEFLVAGESTEPKVYMETKKKLEEATNNVLSFQRKLEEATKEAEDSEAITKAAKKKHEELLNWDLMAGALSPTGIPLKLTAQAIAPINKRLSESAETAGWPLVTINNDLSIGYGGRDFRLLSESERWRVDAMLVEALSFIGGVKFFILDRMDVLSLPNRSKCLKWLAKVSPDHDRIIVAATLKAAPAKLPKGFSYIWLEEGGIAD